MFDTVDDYLVHCYCNSCYYYLGFGNYCTSCAEVAVVVDVAVDNSVDKIDFVDNYIVDNKVVAAVDAVADAVVVDVVDVADIADVVADADGIDEVVVVEVVVAVVDNRNSLFVLTDSCHTDIDVVVDVAVLGIVGNY